VTATTTTTIQGVSVLSREKKRGTDVFELGVSPTGIEVRRPGRPAQQMSWNRVSEWEIEERKGYVLLTLRGRGATTPLIVPGWSLDDLEDLMRDVTSGALTYEPEGPGPVVADADGNGAMPIAVAASAPDVRPKARPKKKTRPPAATTTTSAPPPPTVPAEVAAAAAPTAAVVAPPTPPKAPAPASEQPRPATPSRAERRQRARKRRSRRPLALAVTWKAVVTVALLGLLATAVTLVLLQSAGVISWSFLGPVA
jgi:hypothetical protein